ncbi:MAG: metalloregulator ArsR/SmtB family transcription factor [Bacillota bacterium]
MLRQLLPVTKALSDPTRLRILKLLEEGELCVCQIVASLRLGQSSVSQQLSILKRAGLIEDTRRGRWVYYYICETQVNPYAEPFLSLLKDMLFKDSTIQKDRERRERVRAIPVDELCASYDRKDARRIE